MPYGKQQREVTRSFSRRSRDDDSRVPPPSASAWICSGPAHPAALEQSPSGGRRLFVSSPTAAPQDEDGQSRVDCFAHDESSYPHLRNHALGPASSRKRDLRLRSHA